MSLAQQVVEQREIARAAAYLALRDLQRGRPYAAGMLEYAGRMRALEYELEDTQRIASAGLIEHMRARLEGREGA